MSQHIKNKMMKKFELEAKVTIGVYTEVEAETIEKAIKIAEERDIVKSEWGHEELKKYSWVSDDFDGDVFDIMSYNDEAAVCDHNYVYKILHDHTAVDVCTQCGTIKKQTGY